MSAFHILWEFYVFFLHVLYFYIGVIIHKKKYSERKKAEIWKNIPKQLTIKLVW